MSAQFAGKICWIISVQNVGPTNMILSLKSLFIMVPCNIPHKNYHLEFWLSNIKQILKFNVVEM